MDFATIKKQSDKLVENNDCAVKAVALVTNMPYSDIHSRMAKHGRKFRRGTPFDITKKVLAELNVVVEKDKKFQSRTVRTLGRELPKKGRFLVRTARHILACVNGEVIDWTDGRLHRIREIYQVSF